jgi:hypothetical protein
MSHPPNFDSVSIRADEEKAVVTNPQPKFVSSFESLHVTRTRFRKAMQRGEYMHSGGPAQAADISLRWIGPNDPLHFGS